MSEGSGHAGKRSGASEGSTPQSVNVRVIAGCAIRCQQRPAGDAMSYSRITFNSEQMGGVPCIRALRIPVATVVGMVADGMSDVEILAAYPDVEGEDIREALRFAADAVREREIPVIAGR